jgi:single-stranded-DNA-specific exonuclease
MHDGTWTIDRCDWGEASVLADALGIDPITASILVRRGYRDVDEAQAFLEGERPPHDPFLLGDMAEAVALIRAAVAAGKRICVHGDYDVDGICATALAVLTLRELGADVEWHLPSRFEEGYGVAADTIERLADEGCGLLLTVDCGITAVEEVAAAKARGLDVVVTDHHRPGERLPDCPVVATRPSRYPFPELCGTGVVHKLAQALLGAEHEAVTRHADLVALATIADVVPLLDENRSLAIAGLRALARTQKPGLRALMRTAHVDPAAVDAAAVGFRLAPRINAAGRLCRPDAALDLILTESDDDARRLAEELDVLNRDRQAVEDRILRAAVKQVESWPEARRRHRGYVLWGEDWHEGVIGIVASRLVERFNRPVVLIARAGGGEGEWKGSGRSVPEFDLHGALGACSTHLRRFGGHRAAAGLSIDTERLETFAAAFAAHADATLAPAQLVPVTRVDAIVPAASLTLALATELERLAPFGLGNPDVTLLVPGCEAAEAGAVGDGKHLRFRVRHGGRDVGSAIAFGLGGQVERLRRSDGHGPLRYDLVARLKENRWNGTVAPQLVVRRVFDAPAGYEELRAHLAALWRAGEDAWTAAARAVFEELELSAGARRQLYESEAFRALLAGATLELPRAA